MIFLMDQDQYNYFNILLMVDVLKIIPNNLNNLGICYLVRAKHTYFLPSFWINLVAVEAFQN